jgi:hypothetical protein
MGLGSGIRDPGSGKNLSRIPDPGVKKAPDPQHCFCGSFLPSWIRIQLGSGSANPGLKKDTLKISFLNFSNRIKMLKLTKTSSTPLVFYKISSSESRLW